MRIVKESLKENFERGSGNKLSNLGVGKSKLIKDWLNDHYIINYIINDDMTIDVNGDVQLLQTTIIKFPDYIQFRKIEGCFDLESTQLQELRGCPIYVKGYFDIRKNNLDSFKFSPKYVGGSFICDQNWGLEEIDGLPDYIGQDFIYTDTNISPNAIWRLRNEHIVHGEFVRNDY